MEATVEYGIDRIEDGSRCYSWCSHAPIVPTFTSTPTERWVGYDRYNHIQSYTEAEAPRNSVRESSMGKAYADGYFQDSWRTCPITVVGKHA